jgi:hypothetical protein
LIATASFVAIIASHPAIAVAALVRTVALSGQQAPGSADGVIYQTFDLPALNVAGRTAFGAVLSGSGVNSDNERGMWSEGAGPLVLVAREGSQAPGAPNGVNFRRFRVAESPIEPPLLNAAGQTAFRASLTESIATGIWSEDSGSLALVALVGTPAPGPPDSGDFGTLYKPLLNDVGKTAFAAISRRVGIWSEGPGGLDLVMRAGDPAPGTPAGVTYTNHSSPALNNSGEVAFFSGLSGSVPGSGMWAGEPDNIRLVARSGVQAPGAESGVAFGNVMIFPGFNEPALNNAGQVAFTATLAGPEVDGTNSFGIWSEGSGTLALVARSGSPAPGTPDGVNFRFSSFPSPPPVPIFNDAGQTAFIGELVGSGVDSTNNSGIWLDSSGQLDLLVREGNPAPGADGTSFAGFGSLALNASSQAAFTASLTGDGMNDANNRGIWATDLGGSPQLIVREGDLLEVAPGEFRTIHSLEFIAGSGNGDGRASGFNNRGQLAFRASFIDGSSGLFVSNVVAIPEPQSLVLFALAMTFVLGILYVRTGHPRAARRQPPSTCSDPGRGMANKTLAARHLSG